jgi:hypothetical protein
MQAYYECLRAVRETIIKEQQQKSVPTKLDSLFKLALLCSKTGATLESSVDE